MYYDGIPLIESKTMVKGMSEIPKRKNKSKRIQKKWIKKYGYLPIPDENLYLFDGKLIGHPLTIKKIIKVVNK